MNEQSPDDESITPELAAIFFPDEEPLQVNEPCDFDRISWEEKPQAARIASWMKTHHHDARILDVGCGPGRHAYELAQRGLSVILLINAVIVLYLWRNRSRLFAGV